MTAQFYFWGYINRNHTFIFDFHSFAVQELQAAYITRQYTQLSAPLDRHISRYPCPSPPPHPSQLRINPYPNRFQPVTPHEMARPLFVPWGYRSSPQTKIFCPLVASITDWLRLSYRQRGAVRNKFRKSQILKFADLNFFLDLRTFRKCGNLRICNLWTIYFCDLRICDLRIHFFLQIHNSSHFSFRGKPIRIFRIKIGGLGHQGNLRICG